MDDDSAALREQLSKSEQRRLRLRKKTQQLTRKLNRADAELAALAAQPDGEAERDLGYVFIVTYGRSGSTLLQGVLASNPGWLIRGENGDAMRPLYEFYRLGDGLRDYRLGSQGTEPTGSWFGMGDFPSTIAIRQLRSLALATLLRPEPDTRVVGFKEIRWWQHDDLPDYLDFLRTVFPGARFVVNTRDLDAVAQSKWWAKLDDPIATLTEYEQRILAAHEHLGDASFHVRYDDYVADPDELKALFDWLGEPFDAERIRSVLATKHSY